MNSNQLQSEEYDITPIREYFDDYNKYYPDKWFWTLKQTPEQNELYLNTRARRANENDYKNRDLLPNFYSIEQDANQFGLNLVEWQDFFGLIWIGKKGMHARAGAPDYAGSLYYYDENASDEEAGYCVSSEYNAYDNQPPNDIYTRIMSDGINYWIDTANVVDVEYKYQVNNHLFKDTYITLKYEDDEEIVVYSDYMRIICGLLDHKKKALVKKLFSSMNEHFDKLRASNDERIRAYYPGKTAEEMFYAVIPEED